MDSNQDRRTMAGNSGVPRDGGDSTMGNPESTGGVEHPISAQEPLSTMEISTQMSFSDVDEGFEK